MTLVWTREALEDRRTIYSYIEADNPRAALTLDSMFTEKASLLLQHPSLGRTGRVADTREWVVHQNYILVYDTDGAQVRILRLMHASQRFET
jgi:addiction module RelE/StbE family toxin